VLVDAEYGFAGVGDVDSDGQSGAAGEGEGETGNVGEAGELLLSECEVGAGCAAEGVVLVDEVEEVAYGFERVVDLVGDGGGEAADGGKLLGVDEGSFDGLAARDVEGCSTPEDGRAGDPGSAGFEPMHIAVGPDDAVLDAERLPGLGGGLDGIGKELTVVGKDELKGQGFAIEVGEGTTEDLG
jgi:hypothetical protein